MKNDDLERKQDHKVGIVLLIGANYDQRDCGHKSNQLNVDEQEEHKIGTDGKKTKRIP